MKVLKYFIRTFYYLKIFPANQDTRNNRLARVKTALNKFNSSTTFHGIPMVASAKNYSAKTIWIILTLLSFSGGLANIFQTVDEYYQYDKITNVERITPTSVTFPSITFCFRDVVQNYYYDDASPSDDTIIDYSFNNNLSVFLLDVKFKEKDYELKKIDFFEIPKEYGSCMRFNGVTNRDLEAVNSKKESFFLRLKSFSRVSISEYEYAYEDLLRKRVNFYVTDNCINSFLDIEPLSFDLYTSSGVIGIVKAEVEKKLAKPYNNCTDRNIKYRQINCIEECINKQIKSKYNCSIPSYYRIGGLEECGGKLTDKRDSNLSVVTMLYDKHISYIKNLTNEFKTFCENECPKYCESVLLTTSFFKKPNFNTFSFVFTDFSTLYISQIPKMSLFSFISNIGGTLGLFIGISFLSFFEIVELIIDILLAIVIF